MAGEARSAFYSAANGRNTNQPQAPVATNGSILNQAPIEAQQAQKGSSNGNDTATENTPRTEQPSAPAAKPTTAAESTENTSRTQQPSAKPTTTTEPTKNTSRTQQPSAKPTTAAKPTENTARTEQPLAKPTTAAEPTENTSRTEQPPAPAAKPTTAAEPENTSRSQRPSAPAVMPRAAAEPTGNRTSRTKQPLTPMAQPSSAVRQTRMQQTPAARDVVVIYDRMSMGEGEGETGSRSVAPHNRLDRPSALSAFSAASSGLPTPPLTTLATRTGAMSTNTGANGSPRASTKPKSVAANPTPAPHSGLRKGSERNTDEEQGNGAASKDGTAAEKRQAADTARAHRLRAEGESFANKQKEVREQCRKAKIRCLRAQPCPSCKGKDMACTHTTDTGNVPRPAMRHDDVVEEQVSTRPKRSRRSGSMAVVEEEAEEEAAPPTKRSRRPTKKAMEREAPFATRSRRTTTKAATAKRDVQPDHGRPSSQDCQGFRRSCRLRGSG